MPVGEYQSQTNFLITCMELNIALQPLLTTTLLLMCCHPQNLMLLAIGG